MMSDCMGKGGDYHNEFNDPDYTSRVMFFVLHTEITNLLMQHCLRRFYRADREQR